MLDLDIVSRDIRNWLWHKDRELVTVRGAAKARPGGSVQPLALAAMK
jgi:hypothetical protein